MSIEVVFVDRCDDISIVDVTDALCEICKGSSTVV